MIQMKIDVGINLKLCHYQVKSRFSFPNLYVKPAAFQRKTADFSTILTLTPINHNLCGGSVTSNIISLSFFPRIVLLYYHIRFCLLLIVHNTALYILDCHSEHLFLANRYMNIHLYSVLLYYLIHIHYY